MENHPKTTASQVASVVSLPGYKITDVLGKGGMAVVYLAIQESIGRQVALKILAPDHTDDTFTDRFLREARIISNLAHPNIITVYDANVHQGVHYMSMEYVPGNSLRESRDKLTRKQKVDVIKQVANALDYAGKKGYVHRDIKPENILLHEDGRAILTDFGIARSQNATKGLTVTGKVIGTPYYMSPEQTKGTKVDHRSDIYSLGVVLFQALAGYLPYDGPSFVAIGIKHLSDPIPELPRGFEIFQPIINTCMSKDPAHRYQTANDLITALESIDDTDLDFIEAKATSAQRPSPKHHAKTIAAEDMPPVISARPKQRPSNYISSDEYSSSSGDMDVTGSDDFKRLNRRKRWIVLLITICIAAAAYYKRTELLQYYHADIAPFIDPYIQEYITQQKPVSQPLTETQPSIPQRQTDTLNPSEKPPITTEEAVTSESTPLFSTPDNKESVAHEQFSGKNIEEIERLAQQYNQQLQTDPKDPAAYKALNEISNWYVLQTMNAIDTNDIARARQLLNSANRTLPGSFYPQQLLQLENNILRHEAVQTHISKAKQYMQEGSYVVPAGQNAADSLAAALSIDPDNAEAKQHLNVIVSHYFEKAQQELKAGKYRKALSSVELGLSVRQQDPRLVQLKDKIQQEITRQDKIIALLKHADTQLQAGKAVEPTGESAIHSYKEILKLQANNQAALAGIKNVEDYVIKQIQTAIWENKLSVGQRILTAALQHFPNSPKLDQAAKKLQAAMNDRAPRITHLIISDHVISSLLTEQAPINITPTLYLGFTYTNFSKDTTVINVVITSIDEKQVLVDKKLFVSESSGEHIFSIKHPQATFIRGQYRIRIKLKSKDLLDQVFLVQPTDSNSTVTVTH